MPKTIQSLSEKYLDFKVDYNMVGGKRSYNITHLPSGKRSVCVISRLDLVEGIMKRVMETPLSDGQNPLMQRGYFQYPTKEFTATVKVKGSEELVDIAVYGENYDAALVSAVGFGFTVLNLQPSE
jgi:hypothetical protein